MVNGFVHFKAILFNQTSPHGVCQQELGAKPCGLALQVCTKPSSTLPHWDTSGSALLKSGKLPLRSGNTNESSRAAVPSNTGHK